MENVNIRKLPIAGKIQHGMQIVVGNSKKVKELGYFIANINNNVMDYLGNRFAEKYPKDTKIKIRIVDENPLLIRNVRYNQGGTVCFCMKNETQARRKASNKWEKIQCTNECEHRIIPKGKNKAACNKEAKLFFMIPEISNDSIWFMRITGKESIERLETYLEYLKQIGDSLIGDYTLYLTQKPQTSKTGELFNNFILGIYKDNLESNQAIPNAQINKTDNYNEKSKEIIEDSDEKNTKTIKKDSTRKDNKKEEQENSKESSVQKTQRKTKNKKSDTITKDPYEQTSDNVKNYYALTGTTKKNIMNNNQLKEYIIGNFFDYEDKPVDVIIPYEYAEELSKCDLGTIVELNLQKAGDKIYTNSLKYIQKYIKNVAA